MARTTIYGFPYEGNKDEPGASTRLPGPLLADSVEDEFERVDGELQEIRDRLAVLELTLSGDVTITPDVNVPTPNFYGTAYWRGTETVQLPPGFFAAEPRIEVSAHSSVPGTVIEVTFDNPSASSFDIVLARSTTTATNIHWTATGRVLPTAASSGLRFLQTVRFTSTGTFDKADFPGLKSIRVRVVGGGGGGGGCVLTGAGQSSVGGGGGGGEYAEGILSEPALAASETVTVGGGGTGAPDGGSNGTAGGTTSFGALITAVGGSGGESGSTSNRIVFGGNGGTGGTGGDMRIDGSDGTNGYHNGTGAVTSGGEGGGTQLAGRRRANATDGGGNGDVGKTFGGGGAGGHNTASQATAKAGGNGAAGVVIVDVYV